MSYFKITLAIIITTVFSSFTGCSSSKKPIKQTKSTISDSSQLGEILVNPESFVNQSLSLEGIVESVEIKKVNKDITLLILNLTPVESKNLLLKPNPDMAKFRFIENLRQAEDLYAAVRYKKLVLRNHMQEDLRNLACDFKIAAEKLSSLSHDFNGKGLKGIANCIETVAKGYQTMGDAYFSFQKVALLSSINDEVTDNEQLENVERFESALKNAGLLLLNFVDGINDSSEVIQKGVYSYPANSLNAQSPFDILTFSNMLSAEAWGYKKSNNENAFEKTGALAKAVKILGNGDKQVNQGLLSLSAILNKTAIKAQRERAPSLRCAYYGFNGSHLKRCAKALRSIGYAPIKIQGSLIQSNLREEVDVLWLQAKDLEIDGMYMSLNYGEQNSTLKDAASLYNWAEDVKNGDKK